MEIHGLDISPRVTVRCYVPFVGVNHFDKPVVGALLDANPSSVRKLRRLSNNFSSMSLRTSVSNLSEDSQSRERYVSVYGCERQTKQSCSEFAVTPLSSRPASPKHSGYTNGESSATNGESELDSPALEVTLCEDTYVAR